MGKHLADRPHIQGKYLLECYHGGKRYQSWHDTTKTMWPHLHKWLTKPLRGFKKRDAEELNKIRGFDIVRYVQHFHKLSQLQSPVVHVTISIYDTEKLDGTRWTRIVDTHPS